MDWQSRSTVVRWAAGGVTAILCALSLALSIPLIVVEGNRYAWTGVAIAALLPGVFLIWLRQCFVQIGTLEIPCVGVITEWAKPVDAVETGLYRIIWPIQAPKLFPTAQYELRFTALDIYSRPDPDTNLASQPMAILVRMYLRWPRPRNTYTFPVRERNVSREDWAALKDEHPDYPEKKLPAGLRWGQVTGKVLLMGQTYYRLPGRDLLDRSFTDQLGRFLESGVLGGVRQVASRHTYKECLEEKPTLEQEIKFYFLSEAGNPFLEIGLPAECIDVEIVSVKLASDTEVALRANELARRQGEAQETSAKHRANATKLENSALGDRLKILTDAGVPPIVAGPVAAGAVGGEALTTGELRDLILIQQALGQVPRESQRVVPVADAESRERH